MLDPEVRRLPPPPWKLIIFFAGFLGAYCLKNISPDEDYFTKAATIGALTITILTVCGLCYIRPESRRELITDYLSCLFGFGLAAYLNAESSPTLSLGN